MCFSRSTSTVSTLCPKGAKVGTSSLRRQAQLKAFRSDLVVHPLRGNVDTRVRKLEEGEYDGIILAAAGLTRLGKTQLVKEYLSEDFMCPAAGQGALGIEIREGDVEMRKHLAFLNDADCARRDYLRADAAEQARRRMSGSDWRFRADERWQAATHWSRRVGPMALKCCASSRAEAILSRWANSSATRC